MFNPPHSFQTHLKKLFLLLSLLTSLLLIRFAPAWAVPPLPSDFYGSVKINDANVNPGDTVSAWINGVKYAETTAVLYEGNTVYSLDVPGDDSDTPTVIEGGVPGDTVIFRVNDYLAAQSAPWQSGVNVELPLTVTTRTLDFLAGWNLITLPITPAQTFDAETLLQAINAQGGNCQESARWYNSGWSTYTLGLPFGKFPVVMGEGYFVRCTQGSSWTFEGTPLVSGVTLNLNAGWNLVGFPYPSSGHTASTILSDINAQGGSCTTLTRWYNSGWVTYVNTLPFNNFDILPYEGYFLQCTASSSYTP